MKIKKTGITLFAFIYNLLSITGLYMSFFGLEGITGSSRTFIGDLVITQMAVILITVLFSLSAYQLYALESSGVFLPILLLTIIIVAGMIFLIPLLISHLVYFTRPAVRGQFKDYQKWCDIKS